jgi:hypothetical protein
MSKRVTLQVFCRESRQQKWKGITGQSILAGILLIAILLLKSENSTEFIYF